MQGASNATDTPVDTPLLSALRDVEKACVIADDLVGFTTCAESLGEALCEVTALRNRFDAMVLHLVDEADRVGVAQAAGLRTLGQFVGSHTNAEPQGTNADVTLARWLRDFPIFAAALSDTVVSKRHLHYVRKKLDNYRTRTDLIDGQQFLVDTASGCTFQGFETACQYWLVAADPDGEEPKDQVINSKLSLGRGRGGRLKVDGEVDAVNGQLLQTAIDREAEKLLREDNESGVDRTEGQRRIAALIALVERGAQRADGSHGSPLVNIVMSQKVAEWAIEQLTNPNPLCDRVPVDANDVDGRCELIDGTPIHPAPSPCVRC